MATSVAEYRDIVTLNLGGEPWSLIVKRLLEQTNKIPSDRLSCLKMAYEQVREARKSGKPNIEAYERFKACLIIAAQLSNHFPPDMFLKDVLTLAQWELDCIEDKSSRTNCATQLVMLNTTIGSFSHEVLSDPVSKVCNSTDLGEDGSEDREKVKSIAMQVIIRRTD